MPSCPPVVRPACRPRHIAPIRPVVGSPAAHGAAGGAGAPATAGAPAGAAGPVTPPARQLFPGKGGGGADRVPVRGLPVWGGVCCCCGFVLSVMFSSWYWVSASVACVWLLCVCFLSFLLSFFSIFALSLVPLSFFLFLISSHFGPFLDVVQSNPESRFGAPWGSLRCGKI